jgi:hypothetical protein
MIFLNNPHAFQNMPIEFAYVIGAIFIAFLICLPIKLWMRRKNGK